MPRIQTESLAAHRDWRRSQLIDAAAAIALESGGHSITVAAIGTRFKKQGSHNQNIARFTSSWKDNIGHCTQ